MLRVFLVASVLLVSVAKAAEEANVEPAQAPGSFVQDDSAKIAEAAVAALAYGADKLVEHRWEVYSKLTGKEPPVLSKPEALEALKVEVGKTASAFAWHAVWETVKLPLAFVLCGLAGRWLYKKRLASTKKTL